MTVASQMLDTYPADLGGIDRQKLAACIEACFECAQSCTACADACLSEDNVSQLIKCIRTDLDCADVCETTGRVLSRHTGRDLHLTHGMLEACATACKSCGDVCAEHAEHGMKHCQPCAESCRRCEQSCRDLIASLG